MFPGEVRNIKGNIIEKLTLPKTFQNYPELIHKIIINQVRELSKVSKNKLYVVILNKNLICVN